MVTPTQTTIPALTPPLSSTPLPAQLAPSASVRYVRPLPTPPQVVSSQPSAKTIQQPQQPPSQPELTTQQIQQSQPPQPAQKTACSKCGAVVQTNWKYCTKCGNVLTYNATTENTKPALDNTLGFSTKVSMLTRMYEQKERTKVQSVIPHRKQ